MSSRYMNYLRKNTKFIMVVMSIVCMMTFVVGAALSDWANSTRRAAENRNPIAVTWVKGKVHDSDLELLRGRHIAAYRFLAAVIETALERGGRPVINGRQLTLEQARQGFEVGIPSDNSEEAVVQTMVLAEEGRRMGIVVDNEAVFAYLAQISSPELKQGDWYEIASQVVERMNMHISVSQIIEHLAYELRAQHVRALTASAFLSQGVPPAEAFDMFNRLNRKLAIEAYPIDVDSYVKDVKGEPTEAEAKKLFDEGKYRDPDPSVDEPGFHKPHKLAFKYLKVSFAPFLDEAKKQITEEQIEEAYQKDVSQGLHKVQELPAEPEKKESTEATPEKPADSQSLDAAKDAAKPTTETPATEKPADKAEEKPADSKPEEKSGDKGNCELTDDPPATDKPADTKPADDKSAEPKTENAPADKPATEKSDAAAPADAAATTPPAKEPKFKPLSEVHDQILTRLAQPIAEEARKKAVAEITTAVEKYGKAVRRYNDVKSVKKNADLQPPPELDLAPIAVKYNFPSGETPLVDRFEVAKYEIGQKVQQIDMQALQIRRQIQMLSFADIAFSQDEPLFTPDEARSSESDVNYIYFRTAEEKSADVTLKDVRPQVVDFWKKRKAFEMALTDAQKLADKAKGAGTLADAVPDPTKIVAPPLFSWVTSGGFGMGQPELTTIKEIELAGRDFMKGVFALKPGEAGTAPNQPHSRVYVVRAMSQEPDDARLQLQFSEMGYNQLVLMLASGERQFAWYQSLRNVEHEYRVTWQRPPRNDRRM